MAKENKNLTDNIGRSAIGAIGSAVAGQVTGIAANTTAGFTHLHTIQARKPKKIRDGSILQQIDMIKDKLNPFKKTKVKKSYLSDKAEKAFNNEIRNQAKKYNTKIYDSDTAKPAKRYGQKGSKYQFQSESGKSGTGLKQARQTNKKMRQMAKRIPAGFIPSIKVPKILPTHKVAPYYRNSKRKLNNSGVFVNKKYRGVAPEVVLHELGHAKYYQKASAAKALATRAGMPLAFGASLGQAFTKKDSKAEKALSVVANFGMAPQLIDEGHANLHAYKSVKKVVKKNKLNPKYLKGSLKSLGAAYGTYASLAAMPIVTNYVAKKQKGKEI